MPPARTLFRPALALVVGVLMLLHPGLMTASTAAPGESITLRASATGDVLLGDEATITLTARNVGTVEEYNLSFRYVLPAGVRYVAGSSPASVGEPVVRTDAQNRTVLLWVNVSDLPVSAEQVLAFKVTPDASALPVGSSFSGTAEAYASADERTVPKFNASGAHTSGASTQATAPAVTTTVSAIRVEKSEPSPEHELLRGVHAHATTYTLKVTNNAHHTDNGVALVDFLPAQLEFLGCGTADHTSDGAVEYPGAPRLDAIADLAPSTCPAPISVTTVADPAGLPAGIYTRVEWALGAMAAGEVVEVTYAAGIPQRANSLDFGGATPSGASLRQGANLDNNNGPSTRETSTEQTLTNRAEVTARYTGALATGASATVTDTDSVTVTAEDVAIQKSVSTGTFAQGKVATWTLDLQTGEYADASDIVITDELPDGLCPIGGVSPCTASGASEPSVDYRSVDENDDGSYTIVFEPIDLRASGTRSITFDTLMRSSYRENTADDVVTVAGDAYVNRVNLTATTTALDHVDPPAGDPATRVVSDESSAGIESQSVELDKRIQPNTARPYVCSDDEGDYENTASNLDRFTYGEGSRVCFLLEVQFPSDVHTKNPVLTDFLPEGLTYEGGEALPGNQVAFTTDASNLTFRLGTVQGSHRYVEPGKVFRYRVSATVTAAAAPGAPDVPGNLAKLVWTNTADTVSFLRDQVDFRVPPAPPVSVTKATGRTSVKAGDVGDFTVAVGNGGRTAQGNAVDVVAPTSGTACRRASPART